MVAQAERHEEVADVASGIEEFCRRVQSGLATATLAQQRELVELLIDRVIVTDDDVEMRYSFLATVGRGAPAAPRPAPPRPPELYPYLAL